MLYINDDNATTGIVLVRSEENGVRNEEIGVRSYDATVYTLSGQKVADSLNDARISNLKQGVYIMNGKKIGCQVYD